MMEHGNNIVIIGAGSTLLDYKSKLYEFIRTNKAITIGINNMTSIFIPNYHLWIDKNRFLKFGDTINNSSIPIFNYKWSDTFIRTHWNGKYKRVYYTDDQNKLSLTGKFINGNFRTAGSLAIMMAYKWNKNNKIFIAGMDGYTYNSNKVHCYGIGFTDRRNEAQNKDDIVQKTLDSIHSFGVNFKIITPTVFKDYYENIDTCKI